MPQRGVTAARGNRAADEARRLAAEARRATGDTPRAQLETELEFARFLEPAYDRYRSDRPDRPRRTEPDRDRDRELADRRRARRENSERSERERADRRRPERPAVAARERPLRFETEPGRAADREPEPTRSVDDELARLATPASPGATAGRRTITIRGQGDERYHPPASRRRPERRHERESFVPDRAALWAVLLGLMLVFVAVASAHAATL